MARRRSSKKSISVFNAACFALAAFLFSYSILVDSPSRLTLSAENMFAGAIGAFAAVPANPDNTLASQLQQKERELDARESAIQLLEKRTQANTVATYSFILSISLFILLSINFYLDWRRSKKNIGARIVIPET